MTSNEKAEILRKLTKIQAHEKSAREIGSIEEAKTFANMLQKMLIQHNITRLEIKDKTPEEDPINSVLIDWTKYGLKVTRRRSSWREQMCVLVGRAHGCTIQVRSGSNGIWLVGTEVNRLTTEYIIVVLVTAAERMSQQAYLNYRAFEPNPKPKFKQSWLSGFTEAICDRMRVLILAQRDAERTPIPARDQTGSALVLIKNDLAKVHEYLGKTSRASRIGGFSGRNATGHSQGKAKGQSIPVGQKGVQS